LGDVAGTIAATAIKENTGIKELKQFLALSGIP
jgi:hypothetical protein